MSISYSVSDAGIGRGPGNSRMLQGLLSVNALLALVCVVWWALAAPFLSEPIKWATGSGLGANPGMFDYPYNLLWALPGAGICFAWIANKSGKPRAAIWLALFPLLFISMLVGWYYLAPPQWH